jgi:hypothetical protein
MRWRAHPCRFPLVLETLEDRTVLSGGLLLLPALPAPASALAASVATAAPATTGAPAAAAPSPASTPTPAGPLSSIQVVAPLTALLSAAVSGTTSSGTRTDPGGLLSSAPTLSVSPAVTAETTTAPALSLDLSAGLSLGSPTAVALSVGLGSLLGISANADLTLGGSTGLAVEVGGSIGGSGTQGVGGTVGLQVQPGTAGGGALSGVLDPPATSMPTGGIVVPAAAGTPGSLAGAAAPAASLAPSRETLFLLAPGGTGAQPLPAGESLDWQLLLVGWEVVGAAVPSGVVSLPGGDEVAPASAMTGAPPAPAPVVAAPGAGEAPAVQDVLGGEPEGAGLAADFQAVNPGALEDAFEALLGNLHQAATDLGGWMARLRLAPWLVGLAVGLVAAERERRRRAALGAAAALETALLADAAGSWDLEPSR